MRRIFIFMSRWIWINPATSAWYISIFLTISILIAGFASRLDDNVYTSLEVLNTTDAVFPYRSKPSRSNPNVMFRRQPPILYWIRGHKKQYGRHCEDDWFGKCSKNCAKKNQSCVMCVYGYAWFTSSLRETEQYGRHITVNTCILWWHWCAISEEKEQYGAKVKTTQRAVPQ